MTTIQIDDQTADRLNAQAKALGVSLQELLRSLAANGTHHSEAQANGSFEEWSLRLHAWAASFPIRPHPVDDGRESIYAGRGE